MTRQEELYNIFQAWIDPNQYGMILVKEAPQKAKEALEEFGKISDRDEDGEE